MPESSPPAGEGVRVFLVDDHEVVRAGLRALLETEPDMEVVGESGSATDALGRIRSSRPHVVIADVRLPDGSGVEVCRDVRSELPDVRVLMLTSFADDDALFGSIMAGASGFLLKQVRTVDLARTIRDVAAGKVLLDPSVHDRVVRRLRGETDDPGEVLLRDMTERERRILTLIADGYTNRQIADEIHLAEKTIKNYVSNVLAKLGVARRSEAAAWSVRHEQGARPDPGNPPAGQWP